MPKRRPLVLALLLAAALAGAAAPRAEEAFAVPDSARADSVDSVTAAGIVDTAFHPPKSVEKAYLWVLGVTVLGFGPGLLIGPSAGQYYAGEGGPATLGLAVRSAGMVALVAGAVSSFGNAGELDGGDRALLYSGLAVYAGGFLYSLIDTRHAVERANARARRKREKHGAEAPSVEWKLSPAAMAVGDGRGAPGLAFTASF